VNLAYLRFPGRTIGVEEASPADMLAFITKQIGCEPGDFGAYAQRSETRPAKGAAAALAALLDDDAVSGATEIAGMSERGLRRLFDRLVQLGAVRELTGRPTFRLYGL
jgi:hypothetical protein